MKFSCGKRKKSHIGLGTYGVNAASGQKFIHTFEERAESFS
jgi:hypothetical protein